MKLSIVHRLKRPIAAAFVGALTTLAFAPFQIWPIAILSPMMLLLLIHQQRPKHALMIGYFWGLGQFATGISWVYVSIANFGGMPIIANLFLMGGLIAYLAIYPALFAGVYQRYFAQVRAINLLLAAPALWLVCDWLRGWVMTGFPWLWLGYSQIDAPLSVFAPIGGVELITLLMVSIAGALSYAVLSRRYMSLALIALIVATIWALKPIQWVTPMRDNTTSIALIQGNIAQELKWAPHQRWPTIMKYTDLSRENWDADIIIWPEAAIPAFEIEIPSFLSNLNSAAKMNNSAVVTGVVNQASNGQFYNSILALGATPQDEYRFDLSERYNKHHLLPFGEFVPFGELLRPIAPFFNLPMSSFSRGDFVQPNIIANERHLAPALCYEIIFNEQVRANVTDETDFLLTLSNDAWFGASIGPIQHMEIARMRALELGKPLIRSTNNGITAVTDHTGTVVATIPQFETAVLRAELTPTRGQTPYQRWGTLPIYLWVIAALAMAIFAKRQRRAPCEATE